MLPMDTSANDAVAVVLPAPPMVTCPMVDWVPVPPADWRATFNAWVEALIAPEPET